MNLKQGNGKVPIRNYTGNNPYILVDFPVKEVFLSLYNSRTTPEFGEKYWKILSHRSAGATLLECAKVNEVSKERVRQIEAKFMRLVRQRYWKDIDQSLAALTEPPVMKLLTSLKID